MSNLSQPRKPISKAAGTDQADPTRDYRKYPKGPNFLLIVILSCVALLLIVGGAILLLKSQASHMLPQRPNPAPNSLVRPMLPAGQVFRA